MGENASVSPVGRWKLAASTDIPTSGRQRAMVGEPIEQLKRKYTDKYVVVDAQRPELARFRDVVGQVKTVNMSGRALVEFDDYHVNIGWYDIDLSFLKVVDKPAPKPKEPVAKKAAAPAAKPAAAASPAPVAAPAKAAGGKPSVADILAAARSGKAAGATAPAAAPVAKPAAPPASAAPANVDRSKMSVADMLAAARAGGAAGAAPAASTTAAATPVEQAAAPASEPAPVAAASTVAPAVKASSGEKVDKSKMTIDQMIAWCREHDTK